MGYSRSDSKDWAGASAMYSGRSRHDIFGATAAAPELKAANIKVREAVDSPISPNSTPIIIGSDVTGSMGELAAIIIKKGMATIMNEVYDRKPVPDPFLAILAIGDCYFDTAPLQATQFEADISLAKQVEKLYVEGGGGNNAGESYLAAHYFAAFKTKADSVIKRGKKGYLFTIGDEAPLDTITKAQIKQVFGDDVQADMTAQECLDAAKQYFEVFHLIVKPVSHQPVVQKWEALLGDRAIRVQNADLLAEVIVSTIQVNEGASVHDVVASWSGDTSVVVRDALAGFKGGVPAAGDRPVAV